MRPCHIGPPIALVLLLGCTPAPQPEAALGAAAIPAINPVYLTCRTTTGGLADRLEHLRSLRSLDSASTPPPIQVSSGDDPQLAQTRTWFQNHQPIQFRGTEYVKFGVALRFILPRVPAVDTLQITRIGEYDRVLVYATRQDQAEPDPPVLYVAADSACMFQRYHRRRDLAH